MEIPHEYDINIGKIFSGLKLQRIVENKQYENDWYFEDILYVMESILKKHGVIKYKWEDLDKKNREWYLNENRKNDLKKNFFLLVRPKEPYSFDVVNYNTNCVVAYDKKDIQKNHDFRMLFALKISFTMIPEMYDFLDYQLKKNFKNDKVKYLDFLEDVLFEQHKIIDSGKIEKTKKYIAFNVNSNPTNEVEKNNSTKEEEKPNPINKKEKIEFYSWIGKNDSIKILYRKLKEKGCIEESTNIYTFLYFFSGKPKNDKEKKPIQWLKSNRLLAYLLFQLLQKKQIENKEWQSIVEKGNCFINKNSKKVTANDLAKAASDSVQFKKKPQEFQLIDSILNVKPFITVLSDNLQTPTN